MFIKFRDSIEPLEVNAKAQGLIGFWHQQTTGMCHSPCDLAITTSSSTTCTSFSMTSHICHRRGHMFSRSTTSGSVRMAWWPRVVWPGRLVKVLGKPFNWLEVCFHYSSVKVSLSCGSLGPATTGTWGPRSGSGEYGVIIRPSHSHHGFRYRFLFFCQSSC